MLHQERFRLEIRENAFPERAAQPCSAHPCRDLNTLGLWHLCGHGAVLALAGLGECLDSVVSEAFSNLNHSVIQSMEKLLLHSAHPEGGAGHQSHGN